MFKSRLTNKGMLAPFGVPVEAVPVRMSPGDLLLVIIFFLVFFVGG